MGAEDDPGAHGDPGVDGDPDLGPELDRIESAVASGDRDLRALGFWPLVRRLKLYPELADRHADQVGRIDRAAFEAAKRWRFPVWLGNAVLVLGTVAMALVTAFGVAFVEGFDPPSVSGGDPPNPTVGGALLVVAAGGLSVTLHDLAHWLVGRLAGIRFLCYFPGGPFRIQPGLKTDYATYLRAPPISRAAMHASGAVASKIAPFIVLAFVALAGNLSETPIWAIIAIVAIGAVQIITDLLWSTKKSDWKKVSRELRIAREMASAG